MTGKIIRNIKKGIFVIRTATALFVSQFSKGLVLMPRIQRKIAIDFLDKTKTKTFHRY